MNATLAVLGLSGGELVLVLVVILVLFGAKRIPDLMRGFGDGVRNFKEGMRDDTPTQPAAPAPPANTAPPASEKK